MAGLANAFPFLVKILQQTKDTKTRLRNALVCDEKSKEELLGFRDPRFRVLCLCGILVLLDLHLTLPKLKLIIIIISN